MDRYTLDDVEAEIDQLREEELHALDAMDEPAKEDV